MKHFDVTHNGIFNYITYYSLHLVFTGKSITTIHDLKTIILGKEYKLDVHWL